MKFDDASWHYESASYPENLSPKAAATHIGMFVAWMVLKDKISNAMKSDFPEELQFLRNRSITPGDFAWRYLDGKFSDSDCRDEGRAFAEEYYKSTTGSSYIEDYEEFGKKSHASEYFVPDSWETYDAVGDIINKRYGDWLRKR